MDGDPARGTSCRSAGLCAVRCMHCRVASAKMLPSGFLASPEMLPVREEMAQWLEQRLDQTALELLIEFQVRYPGRYSLRQLSTLQKRVKGGSNKPFSVSSMK